MGSAFQEKAFQELGILNIPDVLEPGGHALSDVFRESTDQGSLRGLCGIGKVLIQTACRDVSGACGDLLALARGYIQSRKTEPRDTDFLFDRDPDFSDAALHLVESMLLPGSGVAAGPSRENFKKAMGLKKSGEKVTFQIVPHTTEIDPGLVQILLRRLLTEDDAELREHARYFLDHAVMVVGHKVLVSRLRRMFASIVPHVFIVAPKYERAVPQEQKVVVSAHNTVTSNVITAMRSSMEHVLMVCPQGGMTKNRQIGSLEPKFQTNVGWRVPLFLRMPDQFLGLSSSDPASFTPQNVQLYIGQPFNTRVEGEDKGSVTTTYESLQSAGAPVGNFDWGYTSLERSGGDLSRGVPSTFTPIIPRT